VFVLQLQKDQSPFIQTQHGHPGFTPQKVGKNTVVNNTKKQTLVVYMCQKVPF